MLTLSANSEFQFTLDQLKEKTKLKPLGDNHWSFQSSALEGRVLYGPKTAGYEFRLWHYQVKEDLELKRTYSSSSDWYLNIVTGSVGIESKEGDIAIVSGALANSEFHNLKVDNTFVVRAPGEITTCSYYIDAEFLNKYLSSEQSSVKEVLESEESKAFYEILDSDTQQTLQECFTLNSEGSFFKDLVRTKVHHMLLTNLQVFWKRLNTSQDFDVNNQQVQHMLKASSLFENFHQPPTIKTISEFVGMNEVSAQDLFKQVYGKTPYQFFNENRLAEARQLIINSDYRISEIGAMLGFASMSHFSKAFKKAYDILPKQLQLQRQRLN